ncbi:MAG: hypothetical protein C5S43_01380 [Candidatus Methanocomedens sp.]|jgi:uncharacterized LabA/DUF88 family protein|nr:MAG: hypothetical protein C5S43_01380 [ANME-2 cluster archaeon]MCG7850762.1 NYN domain-containing protein [ANME-2 cluster archaeon]
MYQQTQNNFQQRTAVLIDGQNIYLSAKTRGAKPDYSALIDSMDSRLITRAIIYNVSPEGIDQSKFVHTMEKLGFEVKSKRPRKLPDGSTKADWDMQIAIDALALADKVDIMVILTGDSDFVPLVNALKSKGVKVEIISFIENTGNELILAADKYVEVTDSMLIYEWKDSSI